MEESAHLPLLIDPEGALLESPDADHLAVEADLVFLGKGCVYRILDVGLVVLKYLSPGGFGELKGSFRYTLCLSLGGFRIKRFFLAIG